MPGIALGQSTRAYPLGGRGAVEVRKNLVQKRGNEVKQGLKANPQFCNFNN